MSNARVARLVVLLAAFVASSFWLEAQPALIPSEVVGSWSTKASSFRDDAITSGEALYVTTDGSSALIYAPPPIGVRGEASYDPISRRLTILLCDDDDAGRIVETMVLLYDPEKESLVASTGDAREVFLRRTKTVPQFVLDDIARSRTRSKHVAKAQDEQAYSVRKSIEAAEPGATDNPDDAQRLREDH